MTLYLLELFSLSIEEKETLDFTAKKLAMQQQIKTARSDCMDLLSHGFEVSTKVVRNTLMNFFNVDLFKQDLNAKFQKLLHDQLGSLERRLVRKRLETQKRLRDLGDQLAEQNPQSVREYIKLFLRELLQIITELVTGNYMIIRLPDNGDHFLNTYGGSLSDNLDQGHALALELFPQKELYDPDFLQRIKVWYLNGGNQDRAFFINGGCKVSSCFDCIMSQTQADQMLQNAIEERKASQVHSSPEDPQVYHRVNDEVQPDALVG